MHTYVLFHVSLISIDLLCVTAYETAYETAFETAFETAYETTCVTTCVTTVVCCPIHLFYFSFVLFQFNC